MLLQSKIAGGTRRWMRPRGYRPARSFATCKTWQPCPSRLPLVVVLLLGSRLQAVLQELHNVPGYHMTVLCICFSLHFKIVVVIILRAPPQMSSSSRASRLPCRSISSRRGATLSPMSSANMWLASAAPASAGTAQSAAGTHINSIQCSAGSRKKLHAWPHRPGPPPTAPSPALPGPCPPQRPQSPLSPPSAPHPTCIVDGELAQGAGLRVEGGGPQLLRHHLAQALRARVRRSSAAHSLQRRRGQHTPRRTPHAAHTQCRR